MTKEIPKADPAKFIVRDDKYDQHPGYALYCAGALDDLCADPPKNAQELVEKAAYYLCSHTGGKGRKEIIQDSLRDTLRVQGVGRVGILGPIMHKDYGVLGWPGPTPVAALGNLAGFYRGYHSTLKRLYPKEITETSVTAFQPRIFSYSIPGTNQTLDLMHLGHPMDIWEPEEKEKRSFGRYTKSREYLYFRPPKLTEKKYAKLIEYLDPLYDTVMNNTDPWKRKDAALTFYWLVAQATPVIRGGSAHSRILLEYLATIAKFEVPHMAKGYDLWAEAAGAKLELFKQRFEDKVFFDATKTTSADILEWQKDAIHKQARQMAMDNGDVIIPHR